VNVPPRPIRDGTRDLCCPGVCPLRAAPPDSSPSAPSLPLASASLTRFPGLPWRRPSTSRSSSTRRCWVPSWCYPLWSSLPSSGFVLLWDPNLPLGTTDRSRRLLPLVALRLRTLTPPKRSPRSDPLACSVLRGRRFGARLRDLPPHSRFRAVDPLTQLSRRYQGLGWSVGLSRGDQRFVFRAGPGLPIPGGKVPGASPPRSWRDAPVPEYPPASHRLPRSGSP
jgi:hypothetical protein